MTMKHNHTPALCPAVVRKDCELFCGSCVGSAPRATERSVAPSVLTDWRVGLLTAIKGTLEAVIARMTCNGLLAAARLLPPDSPILAVLANLSGWGVL